MTKGKGSSVLPPGVTKTRNGKVGSIAEMMTGAPIAKTMTGTAIATKLQCATTTKGNSASGGSIAKTTTGAPIAATTTGTASRPALLQPPTSMNTNVKDTLMQPPPLQPERMKTKSMGVSPSTPALTKPKTSTNNSGNEGTLMQPLLPQPDTNNKKGKTTTPAAMTKGNSASGDSIAETTTGALIAAMTMGTASRSALLQPPTLTNTNVKDTSMQLPPPQPEMTEKKNKGALPSMPVLTQPTTATNNSNEGTLMQPPLPQHNKITGNTSQDNSMQGTADGDNEVSNMVEKFFFPKLNKMRKLNMVTSLLH
jgi:hypothetical protein